MKVLGEVRDAAVTRALLGRIREMVTRPWVLMEICGGQTHSILRHGLDRVLPEQIALVHGPGCPVCVTPLEVIDRAHAIAARPDVTFAAFGDLMRVPGSRGELSALKAEGADIRVVDSPLDAVRIAEAQPERQVVFFGIGFETTAPANAVAILQAAIGKVDNFSMLVSHLLVPPAISAILEAPGNRVQAFLGPGHVCAVMGYREYEPLVARHHCPVVISGSEPVDLLAGVLACVRQLESGTASVENQFVGSVSRQGNRAAVGALYEVFETADQSWRGIGKISRSGLRIRDKYQRFDATRRFEVESIAPRESSVCISGAVLRGQKKPDQCPAFGITCTPLTPLGAAMVSSEGACGAYFQYGRSPRDVPGAAE